MLKKISIRSTIVLASIAIIAVVSLYIAENTKVKKQQEWYAEKLKAAQLTQKAIKKLKFEHYHNAEMLDNINDPNETGMIGEESSSITTGTGSLSIKLSTTNSNFSALVVQLLKDAGLKKGDAVAVCMTGSFPALNIATLAAIQTLELKPEVICSLTSSSWGATNPDFTWLDMLSILNKSQIINIKTTASSVGGNQDRGMGLSIEGREQSLAAIHRNGIKLIATQNLEESTQERIRLISNSIGLKNVKAFINVGGGSSSIGSDANGNAIPSGLSTDLRLSSIPDKQGVIFQMAKEGIPIIHLLNLEPLMKKYKLPRNPIPLPKPGTGFLFENQRYDLLLVVVFTCLIIVILGWVAYKDNKQHELGTEIIKDTL
jgi:poly-gamma-glutamate system protein